MACNILSGNTTAHIRLIRILLLDLMLLIINLKPVKAHQENLDVLKPAYQLIWLILF